MTTLSNLVVKFTGDATGLAKAAKIGVRAVRGFTRGAARLGVGLAKVGIGAGLAGTAIGVAFVEGSRQAIDELRKLSSNLGTTVRETQQLKLAAEFSGVGLSVMAKSVQQVTRTVGDAQRGLKSASDAVADLGLNTEQLSRLDAASRFETVIKALARIEDPTRRASIAAVILGRGWRELNPLIQSAADTFARTDRVINGLNLGLKDNDDTTERLNDSWQELITIGQALSLKVFEVLAPTLNRVVENMLRFATESIKAVGGGEQLATMISQRLIEGLRQLAEAFKNVASVVAAVWRVVAPILERMGKAIGGVVAVANQLRQGNISGAGAAASAALADQGLRARDFVINPLVTRLLDEISRRISGEPEDEQVPKDQLTQLERQTSALETIVRDGIAAVAG